MNTPKDFIPASSLITEDIVDQHVDALLAMSEEDQNEKIRFMGRFGKPSLCEEIIRRFLQKKFE